MQVLKNWETKWWQIENMACSGFKFSTQQYFSWRLYHIDFNSKDFSVFTRWLQQSRAVYADTVQLGQVSVSPV